jgi:hypothetical protein
MHDEVLWVLVGKIDYWDQDDVCDDEGNWEEFKARLWPNGATPIIHWRQLWQFY